MKAVIPVVGKDTVGILSEVSGVCAEFNANVIEVSQSVLQEMFCMIMMVDISKLNASFNEFSDKASCNARRYIQFNAQNIIGGNSVDKQ